MPGDRIVLVLLACVLGARLCCGATNVLTRIIDVKALTREAVQRGCAVQLRGVVTARLPQQFIMQDDKAGICVYTSLAREGGLWQGDDTVSNSLREGRLVEVRGVTRLGGFAPVIVPQAISLLGEAPLPEASLAKLGAFFRGLEDCRRIEIHGIVQGYWIHPPFGVMLVLSSNQGRFMARLPMEALDACPGWVDAEARIRGVAMASFNTRGELLMPSLYASTAGDVAIELAPRTLPFAAPKVSVLEIDGYRNDYRRAHRQRVEGVVTYTENSPDSFLDDPAVRSDSVSDVVQEMGRTFYLQEGSTGLRVYTRQAIDLRPGDHVEASGFVDRSRLVRGLCEAVVRKLGQTEPPAPTPVSVEHIVNVNAQSLKTGMIAEPGDFDGTLVTCEATLVDDLKQANGDWLLMLKESGISFKATLRGTRGMELPELRAGSTLALTGVVLLDFWRPRIPAEVTRPQIELYLRSCEDVVVLRQPSWWTIPRLLGALSVLLAVVLAGLVWVWLLHSRIRFTTQRISVEMRGRREAALEYAATLRERNRLAANLHDTLLQTLGGISYQLAACQKGGALAAQQLDVAKRMVHHAADELRNSVWTLRCLSVHGQPFGEALEAVVERARRGLDVAVEVRSEGLGDDVPEFVGGSLLLIIQEALLNALKHAAPSRVAIAVRRTGPRLEVEVLDDGKGFVVAEAQSAGAGHFGLVVMRERAERLGGTFAVESRPGGGTAVRVSVSLKDYDADVADSEPESAAEKGRSCEAAE